MTRITAVELRQNLKQVLERVQAGEEITVTYRGGNSIRLVPDTVSSYEMAGLDALLALTPHISNADDDVAFDKRYSEHLDEKYGKYTR